MFYYFFILYLIIYFLLYFILLLKSFKSLPLLLFLFKTLSKPHKKTANSFTTTSSYTLNSKNENINSIKTRITNYIKTL